MTKELEKIPVGRAENIIGQKFNKLTVLYRVKYNGRGSKWAC